MGLSYRIKPNHLFSSPSLQHYNVNLFYLNFKLIKQESSLLFFQQIEHSVHVNCELEKAKLFIVRSGYKIEVFYT